MSGVKSVQNPAQVSKGPLLVDKRETDRQTDLIPTATNCDNMSKILPTMEAY